MVIIGVDPSGNFNEGKGITGIVKYYTETKTTILYDVKAEDYKTRAEYWEAVVQQVFSVPVSVVVCEEYFLYNNKTISAQSQSNSVLETPRLIGVLEYEAHKRDIPFVLQRANIKTRWADDVLITMGILNRKNGRMYYLNESTNDHKRDALRHALHFERYGSKKGEK